MRVGAWFATLLVALAAFTVVTRAPDGQRSLPPIDVDLVAKRVEELRGLRFKEVPEVRVIDREESVALAREEMASDPARAGNRRREQALKLAGLLAGSHNLEGIASREFSAGAYDDETGELVLVQTAWGSRPYYEAVLAHELVHALEDQHFDLTRLRHDDDREASLAGDALAEGSAMLVERAYERRHLDRRERRAVEEAWSAVTANPAAALLEAEDEVVYEDGADYVRARIAADGCRACAAGDRWRPVNDLLRRPPSTTSQILHPHRPDPGVRAGVRRGTAPGDEWRELGTFPVGEADLVVLLTVGAGMGPGSARRAADGWRGGSLTLWGRGSDDCPRACRHDRAVGYRLDWSSGREAREFAAAVPRWFESQRLGGRPVLAASGQETGMWRLGTGVASLRTTGRVSRLAFAPTLGGARRMLGL